MSIAIGQKAEVAVPEYPSRVFTATVARTARAIDPATRTLMVELELPNADRALLPGTFAQVTLQVHQAGPTCTVPAGVLVSRPDGLKVAVVDAQGVVRLQKVKLGRDYGSSVEVLSGLRGQEALVTNPPDDLADDEKVTIAASAPSGSPDSAGAPAVASHDKPKAGS
jgi:RND family efflux transporter MFP subunit